MKRILIVSALIVCVLISGCTSAPVLGTGTLQFSSSPQGAQIYLDNQYKGTTPSALSGIAVGAHTLEFRYPGYQSWDSNITVTTETSNYYAALTPLVSQTIQPTLAPGGATTQGSTARLSAHRDNTGRPDSYDHWQHADVFRYLYGK